MIYDWKHTKRELRKETVVLMMEWTFCFHNFLWQGIVNPDISGRMIGFSAWIHVKSLGISEKHQCLGPQYSEKARVSGGTPSHCYPDVAAFGLCFGFGFGF
jgi:hypothetical protein